MIWLIHCTFGAWVARALICLCVLMLISMRIRIASKSNNDVYTFKLFSAINFAFRATFSGVLSLSRSLFLSTSKRARIATIQTIIDVEMHIDIDKRNVEVSIIDGFLGGFILDYKGRTGEREARGWGVSRAGYGCIKLHLTAFDCNE